MKKKVILLLLVLAIIAIIFIPFNQENTFTVKAPFLSVYTQVLQPDNWENWRPDLRKALLTDSDKISVKKDTASFSIAYRDLKINVKSQGSLFNIDEQNGSKEIRYSYFAVPGKLQTQTQIVVNKNTSLLYYLIGRLGGVSFSDTHINDFKKYMETDSLFYGCTIFKTRVPDSNLIVMRKEVLKKDKFTAAAKMLAELQQYIKTNNLRQMQPLIAQFLRKGNDSTLVNVGYFINKKVNPGMGMEFERMPKGGPLYAVRFKGRFSKRQKVYSGVQQFFNDHRFQSAILPFETYLDNKLPATDTDKVNIQVNFSAYF